MIEMKKVGLEDLVMDPSAQISDKAYVLEHVIPTLENPLRSNREDAIKHRFADMNIVYKVPVGDLFGDGGESMVIVTNSVLELSGLTIEEIAAAANRNNEESGYVISNYFGTMTVLTNADGVCGAAKVLIEKARKELSDMFGGDYFLIPSSIHEFIVVPVSDHEAADLKEMVVSVNGAIVAEADVLSYNVYRYRAEADVVEVAS